MEWELSVSNRLNDIIFQQKTDWRLRVGRTDSTRFPKRALDYRLRGRKMHPSETMSYWIPLRLKQPKLLDSTVSLNHEA